MKLGGIEVKIIWRLHRRGKYGNSHSPLDNALKGVRKDRRGEAKDAASRLIKLGILLRKPTGYGMEVSLNPVMLPLIRAVTQWCLEHFDEVDDEGDYEFSPQ